MRPVLPLLIGTALLLVANGLLGTVLGTRLAADRSLGLAGLVVSSFSVGLVVGSWRGRWVIERVGHIRSFAVFSAIATACALSFALVDVVWLWALVRVAQGFALGGNYLVIESWLNERSTRTERGRVLATYIATCQIALAAGQLLLLMNVGAGARPFQFAALLYVLALLPIALTRTPQPSPGAGARVRLVEIVRRAPVAALGCFVAGCTTGTLQGLGAPFGVAIGLDAERVAVFMAASVLGGLLLQWPVGWLADRFDRRVVIELVAAGTCGASVLLLFASGFPAVVLAAFALGAVAFVLYPVSSAHAHDLVERKDVVATSGSLVLAYGLGSSSAPLLGAAGLQLFGAPTLPWLLIAFNSALATLAVVRLIRRRRLPVVTPAPFVPLALPQVVATSEGTSTASAPSEASPKQAHELEPSPAQPTPDPAEKRPSVHPDPITS